MTERLALFGGPPAVTVPEPAVPPLGGPETKAVEEVLARVRSGDSSFFSRLPDGGEVSSLEAKFARRLGVRFALAVASGTIALEVALRAAGIGLGDEVILSPYDWGAAAGSLLRVGAIPVFADIDFRTYTLDPGCVEACLSPRSKAIVVTHIFGNPADMAPLLKLARKHGLLIFEDAAQALGATYRGRPVGTFGSFGCFSLGRGKIVTGGEGGILVTNDETLFQKALFWSQHPVRQLAESGQIGPLGDLALNGRIHPLAATIASVQLDTLDQRLQDRRVNCEQLSNGLTGIPGVQPMFAPSTCEPAYHCYSPTFVPEEVEGVPRELYTAALEAEGVPIHCGFVGQPLHLRPLFRQRSYGVNGWPWRTANSRRRYRRGDCPVAEARCSQLELGIDANWGGKKSAWIAQIVDAFTKVAEHIEALRAVAREGAGGEQTARRGARVRAIGSQPTWSSWVDAEFS